jgi:hypothetical protein
MRIGKSQSRSGAHRLVGLIDHAILHFNMDAALMLLESGAEKSGESAVGTGDGLRPGTSRRWSGWPAVLAEQHGDVDPSVLVANAEIEREVRT